MDKKRTVLHFILQYIGITIASIMYAMALAWFLNPNQLAPGGVSGIAIVLKEIFPFLPGIGALILIFNIPILLLGVWKFGVKFTISTIYTVVLASLFTVAIDFFDFSISLLLLSTVLLKESSAFSYSLRLSDTVLIFVKMSF